MSEVDWQMAPEEMRSRRSVRALVRLPLWATREAAGVEIGEQRLHVAQDGVAGGGVAVVAERDVALEAADHVGLVEVVADEAEAALGMEVAAVVGDDAGGFLAAMLQGVQAERGQGGGVLVAEDAEDAAFLAQAVVAGGPQRRSSPRVVTLIACNVHGGLSRPARAATLPRPPRLRCCVPVGPPGYRTTCTRLPPGAATRLLSSWQNAALLLLPDPISEEGTMALQDDAQRIACRLDVGPARLASRTQGYCCSGLSDEGS